MVLSKSCNCRPNSLFLFFSSLFFVLPTRLEAAERHFFFSIAMTSTPHTVPEIVSAQLMFIKWLNRWLIQKVLGIQKAAKSENLKREENKWTKDVRSYKSKKTLMMKVKYFISPIMKLNFWEGNWLSLVITSSGCGSETQSSHSNALSIRTCFRILVNGPFRWKTMDPFNYWPHFTKNKQKSIEMEVHTEL